MKQWDCFDMAASLLYDLSTLYFIFPWRATWLRSTWVKPFNLLTHSPLKLHFSKDNFWHLQPPFPSPFWDNEVSSCHIYSSSIGPLRPDMTKGFVPVTFPSFPHLPHSFTLDCWTDRDERVECSQMIRRVAASWLGNQCWPVIYY